MQAGYVGNGADLRKTEKFITKGLPNMLDNILRNEKFKELLEEINSHFHNVKQELYIRNELVKFINNSVENNFAFSEYPKGSKGSAVDLCVISNNKIHTTLEIKYQYPKDLKSTAVRKAILHDINTKQINNFCCTNFLLIIHERSGIANYQPPTEVKPIFQYLDREFSVNDLPFTEMNEMITRECKFQHYPIKCSKPYESIYHFISYTFA